jgi:hypothetical protein
VSERGKYQLGGRSEVAKKQRTKPPSRKRYEEDHPVFSARVPKGIYDRIQAVKEKEGWSNTGIFKVALGLIEVKERAEEEVRQQAYDEGFEEGIASAEELYSVTYPCSKCGKEIIVGTDEEKRAIRGYMLEHRWGHADCVNR